MSSAKQITPATTYQAIVGRLLAQKRDLLKLDQAEVASAVGVTQPTWSRIERGTGTLSIEQLQRACEKLRWTPGGVLQYADTAKHQLERQGVSIVAPEDDDSDKTVAFIGGAALATLLLSILAKK